MPMHSGGNTVVAAVLEWMAGYVSTGLSPRSYFLSVHFTISVLKVPSPGTLPTCGRLPKSRFNASDLSNGAQMKSVRYESF